MKRTGTHWCCHKSKVPVGFELAILLLGIFTLLGIIFFMVGVINSDHDLITDYYTQPFIECYHKSLSNSSLSLVEEPNYYGFRAEGKRDCWGVQTTINNDLCPGTLIGEFSNGNPILSNLTNYELGILSAKERENTDSLGTMEIKYCDGSGWIGIDMKNPNGGKGREYLSTIGQLPYIVLNYSSDGSSLVAEGVSALLFQNSGMTGSCSYVVFDET